MTAAEFTRLHEDEAVAVLRERLLTLVLAGYRPEDALELAVNVEVDVADAIRLAALGCPSRTAVRILV